MGKPKSPTSTSPQVVATLSSLLLLVVSAGLGFYFTELRGPGIRTLLSGSQASELLVLVGGLAAIVLSGHLAIANAARSAQGASGYRKLVRKASEVDHTDPQVVSQFDAFPELRDFVNVLVAEKEQGHQLEDALESARGETKGLFAGMERSLKDLGKMREDHPSELGRKVATLWNILVERMQEAEAQAVSAKKSVGTVTTAVGSGSAATDMEKRLYDLEERVQQLLAASAPGASSLLVTEDEIVAAKERPLLMPEDVPEVIDLEDSFAPIGSELTENDELDDPEDLLAVEGPSLEALEPLSDAELENAGPQTNVDYSDNGSVIIERPDWEALRAAAQAAQAPPARAAATPPAVEASPSFDLPWRQDKVAVPDPAPAPATAQTPAPAPAKGDWQGIGDVASEDEGEHTFTEWSGAGFGSLSRMTSEPVPASSSSQSFSFTPMADDKPEVPSVAGMSFPKFGEPRSRAKDDHVEVTYDSTEIHVGNQFKFDTAEEALIDEGPTFEIDEEVVDLSSLGAVENKE